MNELFSYTDADGDQVLLFRLRETGPWAVNVTEVRDSSVAHLDRAALERLSAAILSELADTPGTPPEGPAGASTPSTPSTDKRDCVCGGASTRRAQALVAASRTVATTAGSADVITRRLSMPSSKSNG